MRRLAVLIKETKAKVFSIHHKSIDTIDVFRRRNLSCLEQVIEDFANNNDITTLKNCGYTIMKSAKALKSLMLLEDQDGVADEIDKFLTCFNQRWMFIFTNSENEAQIRRLEHSRKPKNLPKKEDLSKLKNHILAEISKLSTNLVERQDIFVFVRQLVLSRLIMYNGRRSGEPSLMQIKHMEDALSGAWTRCDESPSNAEDHYIGYIPAKNPTKPVDILIPVNLKPFIKYLMSPSVRRAAGVEVDNVYIFPSLRSQAPCSGYHDFKKIATDAGVHIRSTQLRHYLSSLRSKTSEEDDDQFYEHLGHSKNINQNVYQVPRAKRTLLTVGKFLKSADASYGQNSATETENRCESEDASEDSLQMDMDKSEYHGETSQTMETMSMRECSNRLWTILL